MTTRDVTIIFVLMFSFYGQSSHAFNLRPYASFIPQKLFLDSSNTDLEDVRGVHMIGAIYNLSVEERRSLKETRSKVFAGLGLAGLFQLQLGFTEEAGAVVMRARSDFTPGQIARGHGDFVYHSVADILVFTLGYENDFSNQNNSFLFTGIGINFH